MHVVHVDRQRSFTGQIQRGLREVEALLAAGHRVQLIAHPGSELARRGRALGVPVHELSMRGNALYLSALRAARTLRGQGVDILHCHGGRDQLLALTAARLARIPHVLRTKHNHSVPHGRRKLASYRRCTRVVAVSGFVRDALVAAGLDARRVVSIPTAVDLARFAPRPRDAALAQSLGLPPDALVVGNVSSLHDRKGIDTLLRAFAALAKGPHGARLRLLLVGPVRPQWPALARELGVEDRVIFPGFRHDVPALLSLFDVYALPSHHEALGTGALEAMAAGRAVVAGDVEGLAEAVADTGVRVPPGDPERLAAAIAALLDDPGRRAAFGAAARARAEAEYGVPALSARMLALYEEVLAPRARPADRRSRAASPAA